VTAAGQPAAGATVELYDATAAARPCPCDGADAPRTDEDGEALLPDWSLDDDDCRCPEALAALRALGPRPPVSPRAQATTDADGRATLPGPLPTQPLVRVELSGFPVAEVEDDDVVAAAAQRDPDPAGPPTPAGDDAGPDAPTRWHVELRPAHTLELVAIDEASQQPAPDAELVALTPLDEALPLRREGAVFAVESSGVVHGVAWAPGYARGDTQVVIDDARPRQLQAIHLHATHVLTGQVVERGAPAADAVVALDDSHVPPVRTDARGRFRFDAVPDDGVHLRARRGESVGELQLDGFDEGRPVTVELHLGASVEVTVVAPDGSPAADTSVRLEQRQLDREDLDATTDAVGRAEFHAVPAGRVEVSANPDDGPSSATRLTLHAGQRAAVELQLEAATHLAGRVFDHRGAPVADAELELQATSDGGRRAWLEDARTRTEADGTFDLDLLGAGDVVLVATGPGGQQARLAVTLPHPDPVELHLPAPPSLEVRVLDADGPLAGARVFATASLEDPRPAATTDAEGRATVPLSELRGWRAQIRGEAPGHSPATQAVGATPPGQVVELVLEKSKSISGRVVDAAGAPVPGATVVASGDLRRHGMPATTTSADDGSFELADLETRRYGLTAGTPRSATARPVSAQAGATDVQLVLIDKRQVSGRLVDAAGAPVARFQVDTDRFDDGSGHFVVWRAPLRSDLTLQGDFTTRVVHLPPNDGGPVELGDVRVDEGGSLAVQFLDAFGRPTPGRLDCDADRLDVPEASQPLVMARGSSDARGELLLRHLPSGTYSCSGDLDDFEAGELDADPGHGLKVVVHGGTEHLVLQGHRPPPHRRSPALDEPEDEAPSEAADP
jgi:hypothetical protein